VNKSLGLVVATVALVSADMAVAQMGYSNAFTFLKAVRERDGRKVTELTATPSGNIVVNSRDQSTGDTALHLVAQERDFDWLRFLISKGARPDQQNK
jgi:uncharacterized protein